MKTLEMVHIKKKRKSLKNKLKKKYREDKQRAKETLKKQPGN